MAFIALQFSWPTDEHVGVDSGTTRRMPQALDLIPQRYRPGRHALKFRCRTLQKFPRGRPEELAEDRTQMLYRRTKDAIEQEIHFLALWPSTYPYRIPAMQDCRRHTKQQAFGCCSKARELEGFFFFFLNERCSDQLLGLDCCGGDARGDKAEGF